MSEMEHNIGKLVPVVIKVDIETTAKGLCILEGYGDDLPYHDSYVEKLEEDGYRKYFIHEGKIYKAEYKAMDENEDIFRAKKNEDDSIEFETKYYNGGCSFNEALSYALKNAKL